MWNLVYFQKRISVSNAGPGERPCVFCGTVGDGLMTRKWRNVIIGVLVVALLGAGLWLLSRTEDNYRAKYEGTDLSTDVSGIGRSNTYDAYVASYADEAPVKIGRAHV